MSEQTQSQELLEAERRRQQKAAQTKIIGPSSAEIPGAIGEDPEIAGRIANIIPLAKRNQVQVEEATRRQMAQAQASRIAELRRDWNAPGRHLARRNQGYAEDARGKLWKESCDKLLGRLGTGFLVALIGTRGPGKTQMAVETMIVATELLRSARYATAMQIFLAIKRAYKKDSNITEESIVSTYVKPDLLVIDETHERGETPWEDRILTHIVDMRYRDQKDTILIANLDRDTFEKSLGLSVITRLNETGGIITCDWPSFRDVQ